MADVTLSMTVKCINLGHYSKTREEIRENKISHLQNMKMPDRQRVCLETVSEKANIKTYASSKKLGFTIMFSTREFIKFASF